MDVGPRELIVLAVVILVLFGAKRIPELSKGIVESIRSLRGAFKDDAPSSGTKK